MADTKWQHYAAEAVRAGGRQADLLWNRGLVATPAARWAFHRVDDIAEAWAAEGHDDGSAVTGEVFGDGSMKGSNEWAQCGWSRVQHEDGRLLTASWGPLPVDLPVQRRIKRAELWAFLKTLLVAIPPLTFVTDHLAIVTGFMRGRRWCVSGRRPHADV